MRLLHLAHRVPYPPNKGDRIRIFHQLRALAEAGHEIHLVACADEASELHHQADLGRWCASSELVRLWRGPARFRAARAVAGRTPLSVRYYASPDMRRAIDGALARRSFDALLVDGSSMAQFVPAALEARTVCDLVDVDSEKWRAYAHYIRPARSWLYALEGRRLRRYERAIVGRFPRTVVSTRDEAELLRSGLPASLTHRVKVIGNGVDLDDFGASSPPKDRLPSEERGLIPDGAGPLLVCHGTMSYFPNAHGALWFAEKVLPLIQRRVPATRLLIVGRDPDRMLSRLSARPGVTVTGEVPDVRPYLAAATAVVVPMHIAPGVQNKLLAAMAAGCAIVATTAATAGLDVDIGQALLTADTAESQAEAVLSLLGDAGRRQELGRRARAAVEQMPGWTALGARLADLLAEVSGSPADAPLEGAGA